MELLFYFKYLDELRESGVTNMFGSPAYLQREFGISKQEAFKVFGLWSKTFSKDKPLETRVEDAIDLNS